MKRFPCPIAAAVLLAALSPAHTQAAANTWNNAFGDFLWTTNAPSVDWTSGTAWIDGDDAIFGATGIGTVTVSDFNVTANSVTFNSAGYSIAASGGSTLTLGGTTPTITNNADVAIAASIYGTSGLT